MSALVDLIPATIAYKKGKSFYLWLLYSFLLWIIALVHSILLKKDDSVLAEDGMLKKCPYCGELKKQVETLQAENKKLENAVAMYVPKAAEKVKNTSEVENQPVSLVSLQFPEYVVPQISVTFVNNSTKVVDAIEFSVLCFDNFGQPANYHSSGNVINSFSLQETIQPGNTGKSSWNVYSMSNGTKKGKVVVTKVHFTDGAIWVNNEFDKIIEKEKVKLE